DQLRDRAADLAPAPRRHDAVGAGPVTAVDDRDPAGRTVRAGQRARLLDAAGPERGREWLRLQLGRELDLDRPRRGRRPIDALEERVELDRAEELVDVGGPPGQLRVIGPDHAAADRDRDLGAAALERLQLAELPVGLLL